VCGIPITAKWLIETGNPAAHVYEKLMVPSESAPQELSNGNEFPFSLGKMLFISHTYLWYIFASNPNLGYRKRILLNTSSMPLDGAPTTPT
jgi:hypothetical protein